MEWTKLQDQRLAVITELCSRSGGTLGRTALMKLCYFLQTVKDVPLGYNFTLYSYGPFDSNVLADLGTAESFGAVRSSVTYYPGGYGYLIRKADRGDAVMESAKAFLDSQRDAVDWVVSEFGVLSSGALELQSTLVFVDREAAQKTEELTLLELSRRVKAIKPHFQQAFILENAQRLYTKDLLRCSKPECATA